MVEAENAGSLKDQALHKPVSSFFDSMLMGGLSALGAVAAVVLLLIPKFYIPAEDAVILFQFSRNLAETGAITYITFGPHAEGATDFAWMVLISIGIKLGFEPFWFVALINFGAVLVFAALLIKIAGRRITLMPMLFIIGCFAIMPQFTSAIEGFSTLPFACLLVLLVWYFLRRNDTASPLIGLLLCLFRPDGVVFAVPLLLASLILYPGRVRRLAMDIIFFVLPGIIYFLWRWHYFGHLLPLPFMVKSDTPRFAHLVVLGSVYEIAGMALFTLIVLFFVLWGRLSDVRNRAVLLCLVVLPNLFYMTMRLDQNIGLRFYIYLPVGIAVLIAMNWQELRPRRSFLLRLGLVAWLLLVFHTSGTSLHGSWGAQFTNRKAIAQDLAKLPHGILLTTEAGITPYYSRWPSYDAWGLSTARFAGHLLQPSDVTSLRPDLVQIHAGGEPECIAQSDWHTPYKVRTWQNMIRNLVAGTPPSQYDLWLAPIGNIHDRAWHGMHSWDGEQECWLVRRDSPLRAGVEAVLVRHGALTAEEYAAHTSTPSDDGDAAATNSSWKHSVFAALRKAWHSL